MPAVKDRATAADQVTVEVLARCPHCGAALPDRAQWCSLCLADLRPVIDAEPELDPGDGDAGDGVAALERGLGGDRPAAPSSASSDLAALGGRPLPAEAEAMLSRLGAASAGSSRLLSGGTRSRAAVTAIAVGGGVAVALVLVVVFALVGLLL
ncbi:MAG: zinc ribbon domain-containing protein [Actinomycetota bacterium]|nr:MAG: zinc ribbon domain-containing protein [Actinomycetota bacterium]